MIAVGDVSNVILMIKGESFATLPVQYAVSGVRCLLARFGMGCSVLEDLCNICYQPNTMMLFPWTCMHCGICAECIKGLKVKRCPICNCTESRPVVWVMYKKSSQVIENMQELIRLGRARS